MIFATCVLSAGFGWIWPLTERVFLLPFLDGFNIKWPCVIHEGITFSMNFNFLKIGDFVYRAEKIFLIFEGRGRFLKEKLDICLR